MVIIESVVAAIISFAVAKGATMIETKKDAQGNTIVLGDGKIIGKVAAELAREQPFDFIRGEVFRIATTNTERPDDDNIDYIFDNPFDKEVQLVNLSLVGNVNFYLKGFAEVKVNGILVFDLQNGDLDDVDLSEIPMPPQGMVLKRNDRITVKVWSSDGSEVALTILPLVAGFLK